MIPPIYLLTLCWKWTSPFNPYRWQKIIEKTATSVFFLSLSFCKLPLKAGLFLFALYCISNNPHCLVPFLLINWYVRLLTAEYNVLKLCFVGPTNPNMKIFLWINYSYCIGCQVPDDVRHVWVVFWRTTTKTAANEGKIQVRRRS